MSGLSGCPTCGGTGDRWKADYESWLGHYVPCWCVPPAARIAELETALLPFSEDVEPVNVRDEYWIRAAEVMKGKT